MFATAIPPARCLHCTFRAQQLHLQSIRIGRHIHVEPFSRHSGDESTRYRSRRPLENAHRRDAESKAGRQTSAGSANTRRGDLPIRRYIAGNRGDTRNTITVEEFETVLPDRLDAAKQELRHAPLLQELDDESDGSRQRDKFKSKRNAFEEAWSAFSSPIIRAARAKKLPGSRNSESDSQANAEAEVLQRLRDAWSAQGQNGLDRRVKYEFYHHVTSARFTRSEIQNQAAVADLRYPTEWFPATRAQRRKIHLHVGPTNSGKTYHALQRLEQATKGVYAGPLRLLAHEVYTRMNAKGKPCALITGEERRAPDGPEDSETKLSACTVEMMPLNTSLDVAVIDEIQMIGNAERGWAWTQALLGVKADEVHLCGEERTVPLLREICASLGEEVEVHRYQRLSPLKMEDDSLDGDLSKLRKGDCVVSFSVMGIHSLRKQIEHATGKKVATVYGSLPPETRAQQARLFNEPDNDYDYLVASDAVGMGLNLAIKRIIFETSTKYDGSHHRTLSVADIKQIAGRAGRYRTAAQATMPEEDVTQASTATATESVLQPSTQAGETRPHSPPARSTIAPDDTTGWVTTLQKVDWPVVNDAMASEPEPIRSAGLFPPAAVLERFSGYFPPRTPFSYILTRLHEVSQLHPRFHLCGLKDQIWLADIIEPVRALTVTDRNIICSCPASFGDRELWKDLLPALAKCIAESKGGSIVDIEELPLEALEPEVTPSREFLRELERLHKGVVAYLWLSYRFAGVFRPRNLAFHVKTMVEEKIETVLGSFSFTAKQYRRIAEMRKEALLRDIEAAASASQGEADAKVNDSDETAEDDEVIDEETLDDEMESNASLKEQTSLTAGGDHFGGESDLGLHDPFELDEVEHPETASSHESVPSKDEGDAHAGRNQLGGVPPKHLSHLEADATELERAMESRP